MRNRFSVPLLLVSAIYACAVDGTTDPIAILLVITFGFGLLFAWPISIIWGAMATSAHNEKLIAGAKAY